MKINTKFRYTQDQVSGSAGEQPESRSNTKGVSELCGSAAPFFVSPSDALARKLALDLSKGQTAAGYQFNGVGISYPVVSIMETLKALLW